MYIKADATKSKNRIREPNQQPTAPCLGLALDYRIALKQRQLFYYFTNLDKFVSKILFKRIRMLGRKQSLKGEQVLADYGPEESLNESADIEWVNKVNKT